MIIEIIREKLLGIQVCSDITPEQLEDESVAEEFKEKVNSQHPCGTTLGWCLSDNEEHLPGRCEEIKGRWHYVFIC